MPPNRHTAPAEDVLPWRRFLNALLCLIPLFAIGGCSQEDVYFCRTVDCSEKLVQEIDNASVSVHTAIYAMTFDPIVEALEAAAARPGVEVKVVAQEGQTDVGILARLNAAGAQTRFAHNENCTCGGQSIMHHKFTVIDGRTVMTGSYNYSCRATYCSDEHILRLTQPRVADEFETEFAHLFDSGVSP